MSDHAVNPETLAKQITRLERQLARLRRRSDVYSWVRLGIFVGGLAASIWANFAVGTRLFVVSLVLTVIAFAVAVSLQRRIIQSIARHEIWIRLRRTQIARIQLDWSRIPLPPPFQPKPTHPFGADLDLTGDRSLSHLISTSVSYEGGLRLQAWLLNPVPDVTVSLERQTLVRELKPMARFRDRLILNATLASKGTNRQNTILEWLNEADAIPLQALQPMLVLFSALAVVNWILFLANALHLMLAWWQLSVVIYFALYFIKVRRMGNVFETAAFVADELIRLREVFAQLETYPYPAGTSLRSLVAPFLDPAQRPTTHLRRLNRILSAASLRGNAMLWFILNTFSPWDIFVAYRFQQMKAELAAFLPRWLDCWFELEALGSLASFANLNPGYAFPKILDEGPTLRAVAIGHPLIPPAQKVCNNYTIEGRGEVDLITGSNMSGKSSFLRTLGVNLSLAYAGGPVNAQALQVSPFRLFTCIKVSDSVTDGVSYFYAEVKRLKALLVALEQPGELPLFFLIDEMFRGTNNRERLIGSRSYIRELVGHNCVGLLSTHDLELVRLADEVPQVKNYHFEETVIDGRMIFDYKLRPGPSPTTNALKIMAMEGLPVDPDLSNSS